MVKLPSERKLVQFYSVIFLILVVVIGAVIIAIIAKY
jgi:hypothetical protein